MISGGSLIARFASFRRLEISCRLLYNRVPTMLCASNRHHQDCPRRRLLSDQLIIAGFHRSGTSLTAQLLHRAGLFLGDDLLEANPSNPYGHFEDRDVVGLHQNIFADNGLTWIVGEPFLPVVRPSRWERMKQIIERRNSEHRLWGFKDPRACLFIMLWKYLMPDAKVLLVYRHFTGPTRSLASRHSAALVLQRGQQARAPAVLGGA